MTKAVNVFQEGELLLKQEKFGWKNRLGLEITGSELVRFLNICAFHRIVFYKVMEIEDGISCEIDLKDFEKLYENRHKAKVRLRIVKKRGLYFNYQKNKKRKAAYFFALGAFVFLYVMSLFIWDISFEGNVRYTDSFLLRFVKEAGYYPGMKIDEVSCSELEKAIRNEYDDITWVSAMIDGTRLVVMVKENNDVELSSKNTGPSDLYASQSGLITKMVTRTGVPQAAVGDRIEKGTMLVSGAVPVLNDSQEADHYLYCQASADVWIRYESWYEYRVNRKQTMRVYHKTFERNAVLILGRRLAFPLSKAGEYEEVYIEQKPVKLFENFYLPLSLERVTYREYTEEMVQCSDDMLKQQVNEHFLDFLNELEKIGVEIIENNVTIEINEEFCLMKGTLILEENAVYEVPFGEQEIEI